MATVGYAREPEFAYVAPGQYPMDVRIAYALKTKQRFREAMRKEGIDPDKVPDILHTSTGKPESMLPKGRL